MFVLYLKLELVACVLMTLLANLVFRIHVELERKVFLEVSGFFGIVLSV